MPRTTGAGTVRRERLTHRRKAVGLTQEQLADLLDVDPTTVARWERGETQPLPWLRPKLATALQLSSEEIETLLTDARSARPADPAGIASAVPRQLPAAVADFTGRDEELAILTRTLDGDGERRPGTVVISAIGGTAGIGKTALALHWAHLVAGRFADGQLYVNLRGFDPSGTPVPPEAAIRGFLDAMGVSPDRLPPTPEAQAGLYRSLLADREMLVLLDNARDETQVRPLLAASPGSLILVTSRNQLFGLAAIDGAQLLSLDVLSHEEASQLLAGRLGADQVAAEPDAADEIARLCAGLPLAVVVAAARPGFPLSSLAAGLRDTAGRLDALDTGDPVASVRAAFSWSYRQLSPEAARMFRLLGLHPGPDTSVLAAASLTATTASQARCLLRELDRACLIIKHAPGRYTFHDLLRSYAGDLARETETESERRDATGRLLDHYLHSADTALRLLDPAREPVPLAPPRTGTVPEPVSDYRQAMNWFSAEHRVLISAIGLADSEGFDRHAWQLPWVMHSFLDRRGHYQESATAQTTALSAAIRAGDIAGQAVSSRLLATACANLGDYRQALDRYTDSLGLYQQVGNSHGEAKVHQDLGVLAARQGHHADALDHTEQALRLLHAIGDKAAEAVALNNAGYCHACLGDYRQASALCQQALALCTGNGDRRLEGHTWDSLGYAEHHLENFAEAAVCYERAIAILREVDDRRGEAGTLNRLGDALQAAGDPARAREAWRRALVLFENIDHPDVDPDTVRAKLGGPVTG